MFSIKKVSTVLALALALSMAPSALAAQSSCSAGSLVQTTWCAFEGAGIEGSYSATGRSWAVYHYEIAGVNENGDPIEVRVNDVTSDPEALIVNDAGTHLWQAGVIYYVEVTGGFARASADS